MASRYVGQLGRYVGQSRFELARIETYEVAMQASQAVIHTPSRSLCVHPSRYIPSGARSSCSKALALGLQITAVVSGRLHGEARTGSPGGVVRLPDGSRWEAVYGSSRP
jgi:hypothetical protein